MKNKSHETTGTLRERGSGKLKTHKGITLIALIITIIFQYDKVFKRSGSNDFLLSSI